ncbi:MAG: 4Fe-4S dicluster domain-containing protein [Eggerthellaceae bacterium]|nr:4Fe-4S dicluster domain-containing protein [Eggerthellaceae bacterium]
MSASNPTRRTFCIGAAALAVGAVAGAAARPFVAQADVLRPPGALPEVEFAARCIRCERCISVCPTDVLYPLGIEAGVVAVKTPALNYASDRCTFCDKCREVCPTQAIGAVDPYSPASGRIGGAWVHEDRCLAFVQPGACGVCVDACEYGALSFDAERRPVVDDALCNGCGECVRICPANVLKSFAGGSARGIEVMTERQLAERGA